MKEEKIVSERYGTVKVIKIAAAIVLSLVLLGAGFGAGFMTSRLTLDKDIETIDFILDHYRKYYYDEKEDVVGVFSDALLDRYSDYYTKEEYSVIVNSDKGKREGIGVTLEDSAIDGGNRVSVYNVVGNSPAQKAGLKIGDVIYSFVRSDGEELTIENAQQVIDAVNSEDPRTDMTFNVLRSGENLSITMQKQAYRETFVVYYDSDGEYGFTGDDDVSFVRLGENYLFPLEESEDTAVIRYSGFSGTEGGLKGSEGQFERVMTKFREDGKRNVILDLRDNGGGFLDVMQTISRYFVGTSNGKRPVVVTVRDKYGNEENYRSDPVRYEDYGFENIIILANVGTASASEALIGAILDYDQAGIVKVVVSGGRTYGKGIMQTTFTRIAGDAVKLTTAKLFWPVSEKCIHDAGITVSTDPRVYNETSRKGAFYDALEFCK